MEDSWYPRRLTNNGHTRLPLRPRIARPTRLHQPPQNPPIEKTPQGKWFTLLLKDLIDGFSLIGKKILNSDKSQRTSGGESSPSPSRFQPCHNSTSLTLQPLVPFGLSLPADVADKIRPGKGSVTKRIVLTVNDGLNTTQQKVILKDEPTLTNPGPSIFDSDHPFPIVIIDDADTPTVDSKINTTENDIILGDLHNHTQQAEAGRNGWDATLRLTYLGNYLEGADSKWYQAYFNDPTEITSTWETVKADFRRKFVGEGYLREAQHKLFGRKQRFTESPREYYYDLLDIADKVDPNMPFATFQLHFENGLHPSMQNYFALAAGSAGDLPSLLGAVTILQGIHAHMIANGARSGDTSYSNVRNSTGTTGKQWYNTPARASSDHWTTDSRACPAESQPASSASYCNKLLYSRQNFRDGESSKQYENCGTKRVGAHLQQLQQKSATTDQHLQGLLHMITQNELLAFKHGITIGRLLYKQAILSSCQDTQ
ncbi:hypothetical protein ABEB36_012968 [Hypothenemus hampei]|uniref:Retrotransposon gag domain-containing protein n=1 Tax=Hypothenemus hampei TaxID=57062 RepID=A0ABD1E6D3_HYPHA